MTGFLRRYVLHVEWHPGYRLRLSIRRERRDGDFVLNGDEPSTLVRCQACEDGFFAKPIDGPRAQSQVPEACP